MWLKQCHKLNHHDWEWLDYPTYKNGDDLGMVCDIVLIPL